MVHDVLMSFQSILILISYSSASYGIEDYYEAHELKKKVGNTPEITE